MIKIGSTLTSQSRLSLMEHLLYRLRLRRGGIFLIKTPEQNGRSFLMNYLEKNLSVHEMVFVASPASKSLLTWLGRFFNLSSPSLEDIRREIEPVSAGGRNIVILIERMSFFEQNILKDLDDLLEKMPYVKVVITGSSPEIRRVFHNKKLGLKVLSRENWPVFSFGASLEFLEEYYSNLQFLSRFLMAFTGHGRPGVLKKLAEHVSIFKSQLTRRTVQVILKNYALTFPFFPRNLGFLMGLAVVGLAGYFAFHPMMEGLKQRRLENARAVLEQNLSNMSPETETESQNQPTNQKEENYEN